ncbi:hypothetical protein EJ07DRAFT_150492 [Lizonia empirigonia]|nr:hypothetical protein EJ07DRAFT_150492 [Lizonia empirigonia]
MMPMHRRRTPTQRPQRLTPRLGRLQPDAKLGAAGRRVARAAQPGFQRRVPRKVRHVERGVEMVQEQGERAGDAGALRWAVEHGGVVWFGNGNGLGVGWCEWVWERWGRGRLFTVCVSVLAAPVVAPMVRG